MSYRMKRPSLGEVVIVTLSDDQVERIPNKNNGARECPATVVRVWDDAVVNVQCQVDGPGPLWLESLSRGDGPGQWRWPMIVPPHVTTPGEAKY